MDLQVSSLLTTEIANKSPLQNIQIKYDNKQIVNKDKNFGY